MDNLAFYNVTELAQMLGKHIMVIDLECTTFRGRDHFGITEVAGFAATTQGPGVHFQSLINPERRIDPEVVKLTGITPAMVKDAPTWKSKFASFFKNEASNYWLTGFNCKTFDFPAIRDINERYGEPIDAFPFCFDVRDLHLVLAKPASKKGTLVEIAQLYGVTAKGQLHRAMADVALTLELLNAIIEKFGLEAVHASITNPAPKAKAKSAKSMKELVPLEESQLLSAVAAIALEHSTVTVELLAQELKLPADSVNMEVGKAIDARKLSADLFAIEAVQDWLQSEIVELDMGIIDTGKLKAIQAAMPVADAPWPGVDYIQLRIALLRAGLSWMTLAPVA